MRNLKTWAVLLAGALFISILCLAGCGTQDNGEQKQTGDLPYQGQSLLVYSGAGFSKAMDAVGAAFEEKYGARVNFNYAGVGQLLSQMEISKKGDVFFAGLREMEIVEQKGIANEYVSVVYHIPAIAVPKGNPAGISSLEDLARPGVKLILGDDQSTMIGKKGAKIFEKSGLAGIEENVVARTATVNEVVTKLSLKQADAGLVFEDNGYGVKDLEIIPIPEEQNDVDLGALCVLDFTKNAELAQAFVDFASSSEGEAIFIDHGFKIVE